MEHLIKEILVEEEAIRKKVAELGAKISEDYKDKDLILVGILKGAVIFMSDLARNIKIPIGMDFMAVSSYGRSATSTGEVRIIKDLDSSVENRC